jgi:hypothetical protein
MKRTKSNEIEAGAENVASIRFQTTDPKAIVAQLGYDNAGRTIQTIEDVGGLARTTNYSWTLDGQTASMTAVNAVTGDQTTAWLYGTTLADSGVARNDLLCQTVYPDAESWATLTVDQWANLSVDGWAALPAAPTGDVTSKTYNRLGEKRTFTDQRNTTHTYFRDKLGRQTNDCVTTVGADTDSAVLQIATAYEQRGMLATVTSTDSPTPGSGTILNQCALTYNPFAQLTLEQQSHSGAVAVSTPAVGYAYDSGAAGGSATRALDQRNRRIARSMTTPANVVKSNKLLKMERTYGHQEYPFAWYQRNRLCCGLPCAIGGGNERHVRFRQRGRFGPTRRRRKGRVR